MYINKNTFLISSLLSSETLKLFRRFLRDPPPTSVEMKVVAAFLLAVLGGKACPTSADIKDILNSVGCETEDSQIELLLKEVNGKDVCELISAGREKLASVPSGGGGVAMASAPSAGGGGAAPAAESKKEEKKEEKEESDDDMGFSLFE